MKLNFFILLQNTNIEFIFLTNLLFEIRSIKFHFYFCFFEKDGTYGLHPFTSLNVMREYYLTN